jgi:hypothetical protein
MSHFGAPAGDMLAPLDVLKETAEFFRVPRLPSSDSAL